MKSGGSMSIWFFIGVSLAFNGAVICGTGIYELISPPEHQVVLYNLHANVWWGAVLADSGPVFQPALFSRARTGADGRQFLTNFINL